MDHEADSVHNQQFKNGSGNLIKVIIFGLILIVLYIGISILYFKNLQHRIWKKHYAAGGSIAVTGDIYQSIGIFAFFSYEDITPVDRVLIILATGGIVVYDGLYRLTNTEGRVQVLYFADAKNAQNRERYEREHREWLRVMELEASRIPYPEVEQLEVEEYQPPLPSDE